METEKIQMTWGEFKKIEDEHFRESFAGHPCGDDYILHGTKRGIKLTFSFVIWEHMASKFESMHEMMSRILRKETK